MNKEIKIYSEEEFNKPLEERSYYQEDLKRYREDSNLNEDEARLMAFYKSNSCDFFHLYMNCKTGECFGPYYKEEIGVVWLYNKEVAEMMGMSVSTIKRLKKKLKDLSYIKVQGQKVCDIK